MPPPTRASADEIASAVGSASASRTAIVFTRLRDRCEKFIFVSQIPRHGEVLLRWAARGKSEAGFGTCGCGPRSRGCGKSPYLPKGWPGISLEWRSQGTGAGGRKTRFSHHCRPTGGALTESAGDEASPGLRHRLLHRRHELAQRERFWQEVELLALGQALLEGVLGVA